MAYIDVLPLAEMKIYLRIDDSQNVTDAEITSMINTALKHIERVTNIIVVQQAAKEYVITDGCVSVYDFPINDVVKGIDDDDADVTLVYKTDYYKEDKHGYTNYYSIDADAVKLVLDVGYATASDVSDDIVQLAKEMVKSMYYEQESNKTIDEMLSPMSKMALEHLKRFIV